MLKKVIKYLVAIAVVVVIVDNSFYIRKLNEVKAASVSKKFNAEKYSDTFWKQKLIPGLDKAIEINELTNLLKNNSENTFNTYAHALGIGNLQYFLVKGEGKITSVDENDVSELIKTVSSKNMIKIATEYVYGNAVCDASGLINMNEFDHTMDFNNVSAGINKIIRTEVLPAFKAKVKKGDVVQFVGAIELNKKHLNLDDIEVTPIDLKIIK
jgi:predicted lipoprotein